MNEEKPSGAVLGGFCVLEVCLRTWLYLRLRGRRGAFCAYVGIPAILPKAR